MTYDLAIIGGGPAGLSAALYALRANRSVILFEGRAMGGTLNDIERIENYPAVEGIDGAELARRMTQQVSLLNPKLIKQFVISVSRKNDGFVLFTPSEEYSSKRVIFCTGARRNDIKPVREFEGSGVSYCALCDGFFYKNKTVVVVGNGFTAHEDVKYLSEICNKVYWLGKNNASERNDLKNVEIINGNLEKILGGMVVEGVRLDNGITLAANAVFIALGTAPATDLFEGVRDSSAGGQQLGKNAFVAGDASGGFKQIVWACAQGAFAATEVFKN